MTSSAPWNRLSPVSVLAVAVVSGLLLGLVALCCCVGEPAAAQVAAHPTAVIDGLSDVGVDPPAGTDVGGTDVGGADAGRSGDGCDRSIDHPAAIVASGTAVTRDLAAAVALEPLWTDEGAVRPLVAGGGSAARAPASHLLCVMRT